jgi:hypothetical protein
LSANAPNQASTAVQVTNMPKDDLIFDFGRTRGDAPLPSSSIDDIFSQSPFSGGSIPLHLRAIRRRKR